MTGRQCRVSAKSQDIRVVGFAIIPCRIAARKGLLAKSTTEKSRCDTGPSRHFAEARQLTEQFKASLFDD